MAFGGKAETRPVAFTMSRNLDAPRERVWRAYTEASELRHWWGPKDSEMLSCTGDLRAGAMFLYGVRLGDGAEMWARLLYREIWPPSQLVFVESYTNPRGSVARHPFNPNWPIEVLTTISFAKAGGGTAISVRSVPQNATEAERTAFEEERFAMRDALADQFERLTHYIAG